MVVWILNYLLNTSEIISYDQLALYSSNGNNENRTEKACLWSKLFSYSNGQPSHKTLHLNTVHPYCLLSDESGSQVYSIKMVTVVQ